jgi:hypothetical protein
METATSRLSKAMETVKKEVKIPGRDTSWEIEKSIEFSEKTSLVHREIRTEALLKGPSRGFFYPARP